jgi:hypothetical protein
MIAWIVATFIPEVAIPEASEHHPKLLARAEIG